MMELPVSCTTLRRRLAGMMVDVLVMSVKVEAQERAESRQADVTVAIGLSEPEEVRQVRELTQSQSFRQVVASYVEGRVPLAVFSNIVESLRHEKPWLVSIGRTPRR